MASASLIITAAGNSTRWNNSDKIEKKEFATLKNGRTVLFSSLESVYNPLKKYIAKIAIVYNKQFLEETKEAIDFYNLPKGLKEKLIFVQGGDTRAESTKNGVEALKKYTTDYIITHDGARPFASPALVKHIFEDALIYSTSIPYLPLRDSIKMVKGEFVISNVERSNYVSIQTPQVFKKAILEKAYDDFYNPLATDDSELVFLSGVPVHLTKGENTNIKITYKEDLE